jgi:geranylgeranyl pyrophosphate synthase
MALINGDLAESMAENVLASSGFPPRRCISAIKAQSEMVRDTGYGQVLDVSVFGRKDVTEEDIERLQYYKTAVYTICGPLRIGALLAGARKGQLKALDAYAAPVGVSFQIIDDVLGFYGDPKKGGPSDISDLKEGKRTFMLLDLLGSCTEEERSFVNRMVGSPDLTLEDVERIRTLAESYGVDAMSRDRARIKVEQGGAALEGSDLDPMMKGHLIRMANDLLERA